MNDVSRRLAAAANPAAAAPRAPAVDIFDLLAAESTAAKSSTGDPRRGMGNHAYDRAAAVVAPMRGERSRVSQPLTPATRTAQPESSERGTLFVTAEAEEPDVYRLQVVAIGQHQQPRAWNVPEETTVRIVAAGSQSLPDIARREPPASAARQVDVESYSFAIDPAEPGAFEAAKAPAGLDRTMIAPPITPVDREFFAAATPQPQHEGGRRATNPWESRFAHRSLIVKSDEDRSQPLALPLAPVQEADRTASAAPLPAPSSPTAPEPVVAPQRDYVAFAPAAPAPPREAFLADALYSGQGSSHGGLCLPDGCPYCPTQSGTRSIWGVDCGACQAPCCATWKDSTCIPWALFGPGEYVGPPRTEHVPAYYLRVNDLLTLTYIASRQKTAERYRIGVGDRLRIESGSDESLDRVVQVQPDGEISLPLIGDVPAAGRTVKDLRDELVERYRRIEQEPVITVTAVEVNAHLQEILRAVTSTLRNGGQALDLRVTPEGTIQAPGLGSVFVQGLTLEELRSELEARYAATYGAGLIVSPALTERATSYVFVGGEVASPGRYTLEGPTTVMQAIAMAGGWNNGGDLHHVVVFRRDENWCLKATRITVRAPFYGKDPCPVNDVWLRDNDLVIVPKSRILCATDVIELYFTRGVYAVFPITFVKDFSTGSSIVPIP